MVNISLIICLKMHIIKLVQTIFQNILSGIPFTPVTRLKFIYSKNSVDQDKIISLILKVVKEKNISSFHANFIDSKTSKKLEEYKFLKRIGIQYHWVNNSFPILMISSIQ